MANKPEEFDKMLVRSTPATGNIVYLKEWQEWRWVSSLMQAHL